MVTTTSLTNNRGNTALYAFIPQLLENTYGKHTMGDRTIEDADNITIKQSMGDEKLGAKKKEFIERIQ